MLKPGALLGDIEREWAIGQALNVLQSRRSGLFGFMQTHEAVRLEHCLKGQKDCFRGQHVLAFLLLDWKQPQACSYIGMACKGCRAQVYLNSADVAAVLACACSATQQAPYAHQR